MRVIPLSAKKTIKALEKMGWFLNNSDGRHRIFAHESLPGYVTVPDHKELQTGTLRTVIKRSGVTVDEFYKVVDSL